MSTVIDHAVAAGYEQIRLEVIESNIAAKRLYLRHGFQRTGTCGPVSREDPRIEFGMVRTHG